MSSPHILEIDAGNSSFKWRVLKEDVPVDSGRAQLADCATQIDLLLGRQQAALDIARVVSVAGSDFDNVLCSALESAGVRLVDFAKVELQKNGVRCGYQDLDQLGVDRWVAVLAAAKEFSVPLVVVDAGSALTIDLIDKNKVHIGGYILPGWSLLHDSLVSGTAICDERIPLNFKADTLWAGSNTRDAIGMGRLLMCVSAINTAVENFSKSEACLPKLVCTGGDLPKLMPHLKFDAEYRPNLVLDGLRVALG